MVEAVPREASWIRALVSTPSSGASKMLMKSYGPKRAYWSLIVTPMAFISAFTSSDTVRVVPDGLAALVGEVDEKNITGHGHLLSAMQTRAVVLEAYSCRSGLLNETEPQPLEHPPCFP